MKCLVNSAVEIDPKLHEEFNLNEDHDIWNGECIQCGFSNAPPTGFCSEKCIDLFEKDNNI